MVGPRDHDAPPEESPSISWRSVLPTLAAVFIATRLLVVLVAALSETALAPPSPDPSWDQRPILSSLTGSDAVYYLGDRR